MRFYTAEGSKLGRLNFYEEIFLTSNLTGCVKNDKRELFFKEKLKRKSNGPNSQWVKYGIWGPQQENMHTLTCTLICAHHYTPLYPGLREHIHFSSGNCIQGDIKML